MYEPRPFRRQASVSVGASLRTLPGERKLRGTEGTAVTNACYPCRILKSSLSGSGGISGIFASSGFMWSHGWAREAKMSAAGSNRLRPSMLPACTRTSRGL